MYFTYSALFKRAVNLVGKLLNCEERIKFNSLFPQKYSVSKRGLRYSRDAILNSVKRSFEYVKAPKIFCVKKRDICHAICITIFKRLLKKVISVVVEIKDIAIAVFILCRGRGAR